MSDRREGECPPGGVMDGTQWSGEKTVVPPREGLVNAQGGKQRVLQCRRARTQILGGMASVHVTVSDVMPVPTTATNQKLVLHVTWSSGRASATMEGIDATRGCVFTIGAADVIEMDAQIVSIDGVAFAPGPSKRVSASVCWGTSINPKSARITSQQILLVAGVDSVGIPIPNGAETLLVGTDTPANLPTLTSRFAYNQAGAGRSLTTLNPNANGTPVVAGAEWVIFNSPVGGEAIIPIWETWL